MKPISSTRTVLHLEWPSYVIVSNRNQEQSSKIEHNILKQKEVRSVIGKDSN